MDEYDDQPEMWDYEHYDEWDRNHWQDDAPLYETEDLPEDTMEPPDEQAIMDAYERQYDGP